MLRSHLLILLSVNVTMSESGPLASVSDNKMLNDIGLASNFDLSNIQAFIRHFDFVALLRVLRVTYSFQIRDEYLA